MLHPKHRGAANELRAALWLVEQGYEVFRNVSQHGAIDIVAIRDGETVLLDVRSAAPGQIGVRDKRNGTAPGVRYMLAYPDGSFKFVEPLPAIAERECPVCGRAFTPRRESRTCSPTCKRKSLHPGGAETAK